MRPTRRPAWLVALAAAAAVVSIEAAVVLLALLGVAAGIDAALAARTPRIEARFPDRVVVGVPAPYDVRSDAPRVRSVVLDGGRGVDVTDEAIIATAPGHRSVPAPWVETEGPLGLVVHCRRVGVPTPMTAYPAAVRDRRRQSIAPRAPQDENGFARGPLGRGTIFESLRDYQIGDDIRRLNWLATARSGHPIVNQFRVEQCQNVILLLDSGRMTTAQLGTVTAFAHLVEATAAVARSASGIGDRVGLVVYSNRIACEIPSGPRTLPDIVRALVTQEPSHHHSRPILALTKLPARRSIVVVLTSIDDPLTHERVAQVAHAVRGRHALMVVSVEIDLEGTAGTAPHRTIATATLTGRQSARVHELRRHGATVVTATPRQLPQRAAIAYLDLKQRGGS